MALLEKTTRSNVASVSTARGKQSRGEKPVSVKVLSTENTFHARLWILNKQSSRPQRLN